MKDNQFVIYLVLFESMDSLCLFWKWFKDPHRNPSHSIHTADTDFQVTTNIVYDLK